MASKGPRSKLDHDSRVRRQKLFEAPKEPPRPKAHWDHVLEEMVWLSKDFEAERKWKLAQAKRVAVRVSKSCGDYTNRGEKKVKEEEQHVRKVALNISKEVKKFWVKIEKLVLYKHQLEHEEKKKKALDKQLDFLLGQTERYSTMLAENLADTPSSTKPLQIESATKESNIPVEEEEDVQLIGKSQTDSMDIDNEFQIQSEDEVEDDEQTIEEDENYITEEERNAELVALQAEVDLPLEELLKNYTKENVSREVCSENIEEPMSSIKEQSNDSQNQEENGHFGIRTRRSRFDKQNLNMQSDELDDKDYINISEEEKDDEATLSEEEELARKEKFNSVDEINLLQQESEIPIEELLARYKKEVCEDGISDSNSATLSSDHSTEDCEKDKDVQCTESTSKVNNTEVQTVEVADENSDKKESENIIADAAAAARSAQPTGNTFLTTKVRTKCPFLIKHTLREYQHIGLDWLVTMYEKRLNGILADEMGLGKTIMTISLLAHLACEKGIWGPHLIVVPTSVMLNWEMEFLKWCPAFKILTYFGSAKERKNKRQGWMKPNYFHICITTYRLVIQDAKIFKRKKWKYLILDEAHLIKNWKSQRWQTLLNFNSKRRILLTGTPLQNDLMELWSLMHFLMPHVFQSHQEFKDWFSNPISGMVEGQETINKEVVDRLHNVLRPFILRRLKRDVEKQLPKKCEHVIYCRLSKRQRNLYEDFIASSETQATLANANYFGMISVIMQLRKVCNHPDLFEGRPIVSSYDMPSINMQLSHHVSNILSSGPFSQVNLKAFNLVFTHHDFSMISWQNDEIAEIACPFTLIEGKVDAVSYGNNNQRGIRGNNIFDEVQKALYEERLRYLKERAASISWWSSLRCKQKPVYGTNLIELLTVKQPVLSIQEMKNNPTCYLDFSSKLADMILSPIERFVKMLALIEAFMFAIPPSRAPPPNCWCTKSNSPVILHPSYIEKCTTTFSPLLTPIRTAIVRKQVYFPDRRLIQFDCGKLQELAVLLRRLKFEGHRVLIFTQMTKMLDILEAFINLYGYTYMRLDGSTPPEERQNLMQRFNTNPKYFIFILSTRSGGVGINLVGADTVIFYDSDWNPAMDQQAQDRCHRIGQTREVHIYRLITECTIEENILKKANQKRLLDDLVIQSGSYNTEFLKKLDPLELLSGQESKNGLQVPSNADVEAALKQAEDEADYMALKRVEQEEAVDNQEFTEEVIGKMDDDEVAIDDDAKTDDKVNEEEVHKNLVNQHDMKALTADGGDEDIDMLADVKQMAAKAAAAGEASSSFENQLRPIDRYAMHFLDLWDPVIDKSALECSVNVNEEEWELDRLEKYKEDLEAEIDEDQEPFLYEKWDADFATKAYKQHVEALAQQQLLEEQENEALDAENEGLRNEEIAERKPKSKKKSKKKQKKAKLKSLKDGSPLPEVDNSYDELQIEQYDYVLSPDSGPSYTESTPHSPSKKRKKSICELKEEKNSTRSSKKSKKKSDCKPQGDSNSYFKQITEANESKTVGKISITVMPIKRIMIVKPEKLKKRTHAWSKDCFPPPDSWSSVEDAMLCATVHEYGTNWNIASDIVTSVLLGGLYRGWYRHPVHCCERYRELVLKYVHFTADGSNAEKSALCGSGKALLKITEEQARALLDFATMQPDTDLHLQKHFVAVLSAVWKRKHCLDQNENQSLIKLSSHSLEIKSEKLTEYADSKMLRQCSKLVHEALSNANEKLMEEPCHDSPSQLIPHAVSDHVDLILDFTGNQNGLEAVFPSSVTVSLQEEIPLFKEGEFHPETLMAESSCRTAEHRLRLASEACIEGEAQGWASSAFPSFNNARNRSNMKSQTLGKHKSFSNSKTPKSKSQRTTAESNEESISNAKCIQISPFIDLHNLPIVHLDFESDHYSSLFMPSLDLNDVEKCTLDFDYDPELLSGLEDFGSFQDIADVG